MIINLILLGGILGISYKSWQKQKNIYNKQLLEKQHDKTEQQKLEYSNEAQSDNKKMKEMITIDNSASAKRRDKKDMVMLGFAIGFSSIGYLIYVPLSYLAPPLTLYSTRRKLYITWQLLKQGKIELESLTAVSIIGATISGRFFISSILAFINGLGDILTARVMQESRHQLIDIYHEMPENVWLLKNGIEIATPLAEIKKGDVLIVGAGEVIPADGCIIDGVAGIDEHRFTGESMPVEKREGDKVFAMTFVLSGKIKFQIEEAGNETSAMKIANVLNHTADYKSLTVLEAESFSRQLIRPALMTSAFTWPIFGFDSAIGVIYSHPKERLKVAAPLSLLRYLKQATDEGMLIKDGRSLELLNQVDTIVFDKTGTLTEEQPHIGQVHPFAHYTEDEIIYFAAIAEHKQKHPLARAILVEAEQRQIPSPSPEHSEYRLGYGIRVIFEGQTIVVGSARFMESEGVAMSGHCATLQATIKEAGNGFILVAVDQSLIGSIELLPTIRPEAKHAICQLKKLKRIKKTYIISGDAEAPTANLAKELGIDHYFAQTLPQEKAALIEKLQKENRFVCYVGDGINDAIAMKQAQVSISLNGASQLATDTAQIILLDQGISHLPRLFELAHVFKRHMNIQLSIIMVPSALGLSTIFLTGMGMGGIMVLNMISLSSSIGYSLFDRHQHLKPPTKATTDQSVVQKTTMRTEMNTDTESDALRVNEDDHAASYHCLPHYPCEQSVCSELCRTKKGFSGNK